ncbi:MAG: 30S ribosomal protein S12 methylthiotransferase RimO [Eubacterium sp.]|nr:30S ribosomal protein S12 methylthiotransferase RimO [Eubacterium sp.]
MRLFFVSLGCDKNLVDSEKMLALLSARGIEITDDPSQAEIIIVNTCGFIGDAKEESIETILEMAEYKKTGKCLSLIASGCLAQRYADDILEEMEEVDAVVGTTAYDQIVRVVDETLEKHRVKRMQELNYLPEHLTDRLGTTVGSHYSYLKIAEGCSKRCTYCIIPHLRGNYRSVPMEEILEEARKLADRGVKELIVIAQETTVYGLDLYGQKKLPELLTKLCEIPDIQWVRIMYCYPEEITDDLLETMAKEPKICHYLDLPIQHCNDELLCKMGRKTTKADLLDIIGRIRSYMPDVALRTTLISGFPGETEEMHQECLEFVREVSLDRLGVFPYSPEEGTPAFAYEDQLEEEQKRQYADEIMEASQYVIFEKNDQMIGKKIQVIVDGYLPEEGVYVGRSYRDAPEVDGCVFFEYDGEIVSGTLLWLKITDAQGYDLIGVVAYEEDDY